MRTLLLGFILGITFSSKAQQFAFGCYFNMPGLAALSFVHTDLNYISDAEGVHHLAKIKQPNQLHYAPANTNLMLKVRYSYRKWSFVALPSIVRARTNTCYVYTTNYSGEETYYKANYLTVGTGIQLQTRLSILNRPRYGIKLAAGINYNYWFLRSEWEGITWEDLFGDRPNPTLGEADEPMKGLMYNNSAHFLSYKYGLGFAFNYWSGFHHQLYLFMENQIGKLGNGDFFISQILLEWDLEFPMRSNFKKRQIYFNED